MKVPDVTKKPLAEAKEILTKASLKVGTITSRKHDLTEEIVLEQTPEAGTEVGSQTPINLVVARKETFEDVLGAITKHKDIGKISIRAATLIDRLSTVGVDSLEKLVALETLSDLEAAISSEPPDTDRGPDAKKGHQNRDRDKEDINRPPFSPNE